MKLTIKICLQQTNLVIERLAYSNLNLIVQELCGLLLSAILLKTKIAKNLYFEHYRNMVGAFYKTAIASKLEGRDIDKSKNVGFRVYDQDIVTFDKNKLGLSACYDKHL